MAAYIMAMMNVWNTYKAWVEAEDVRPQKKQALVQELERRGVRVVKNNVTVVYSGVCLSDDHNEAERAV